jgi:uncharacterized membrane protein (DUF441 family)
VDFPLLIILAIGLAFNNHLVAGAAAALLFVEAAGFVPVISFLENRSLQLGLVFLTIAVLAPFATKRIGMDHITNTFRSLPGLLAIIGGATATYVNGQGVDLLRTRPEVIVGLIVGTIIGVCFFHGIPVGPLAAAGVTALLLNLFGRG